MSCAPWCPRYVSGRKTCWPHAAKQTRSDTMSEVHLGCCFFQSQYGGEKRSFNRAERLPCVIAGGERRVVMRRRFGVGSHAWSKGNCQVVHPWRCDSDTNTDPSSAQMSVMLIAHSFALSASCNHVFLNHLSSQSTLRLLCCRKKSFVRILSLGSVLRSHASTSASHKNCAEHHLSFSFRLQRHLSNC